MQCRRGGVVRWQLVPPLVLLMAACGGRSALAPDIADDAARGGATSGGASSLGGVSPRGGASLGGASLGEGGVLGSGGVLANGGVLGSGGSVGEFSRWKLQDTPFMASGRSCDNCWTSGSPGFERVWAETADRLWIIRRQSNYRAPSTVGLSWWSSVSRTWSLPPDVPGLPYGYMRVDGSVGSTAMLLTSPSDDVDSPVHSWEGNWVGEGRPVDTEHFNGHLLSVSDEGAAWICCETQSASEIATAVWRWLAGRWLKVPLPETLGTIVPTAIHGIGNRLWMVGKAGAAVYVDDGGGWRSARSSFAQDFSGVWATPSGDVFAVGGSSVIRFSGNALGSMPQPDTGGNALRSVWGDANRLWVVGDAGTVLLWDGSHWEREPVPTTASLSSVHGIFGVAVWAVGSEATLLERAD